ncbi:MAG: aldolase/citrate lyase family protein [Kiloniellaceae bacterium]
MNGFVNPLRRLWAEGQAAVNGWIACPSVLSAEALAAAGWNSITVDMQHGTADYADLLYLLPVIERNGAVPLVRVPWLEEAAVMRALDAGALGIIAPMIETAADAARLVAACRYPPEGGRSFGPIRARLAWGGPGGDGYTAGANREILPLAMIETRKGVENLEAIAATPGLGGIYIGPADLAFAHGHSPGFDREEPEMLAIIERIRQACVAWGVAPCIHCGTPDYARRMAAAGFVLTTIASDARFIEAGARAAVGRFRADAARERRPVDTAGTPY